MCLKIIKIDKYENMKVLKKLKFKNVMRESVIRI